MLVRELMSDPVVTVDSTASLRGVVGAMLDRDVGSVVLVEGGDATPVAIVTVSDVLRGTHDRDEPLSAIPARTAGSSPLATVEPDRTVGDALERMREEGVTHLPVVSGLDVVGMLTLTDVALGYEEIREEALEVAGRRRSWGNEQP